MLKWTKTLLVGAGLMALLVVSGRADMTIAEIGNGSITIGDKIFSGFSVVGLDPTEVSVSGSQVGTTTYLDFSGNFLTTSTSGMDIKLFYEVQTTGEWKITSIDQLFNLTSLFAGGLVAVGETVFNTKGEQVAQSSVGFSLTGDYNDPPGEPATGDQLILPVPQQHLRVTKDIFLRANGPDGVVGATIIEQSFHQSVPDGGVTLMLLGGALVGLETLRRRLRV